MKTSTLLLIGGAVAVGYYLSKQKAAAAGTVAGAVTSLARTSPPIMSPPIMAPTTQVVVMPPQIDDNYGPAWGWSAPVWGGRAWRGGHGGHGHGHGGHH
jgi:hypothetical protein